MRKTALFFALISISFSSFSQEIMNNNGQPLNAVPSTGIGQDKTPDTSSSTPLFPIEGKKIGVSLSGGGALGYAHLGFLQAMEEAGIRPDCIAGTSMGAIMGAMYAAGYSPQEIKEIVKKERFDRIWGVVGVSLPQRGGFIPMNRIRKVLLKYLPHDNFDSLKTTFYCCTFDLTNLRPIYKGHGARLLDYVLASAAIPAVFVPIEIDGGYCVDGGVCDNMPVKPLIEEGCDIRIGSYLLLEKPNRQISKEMIGIHAVSYSIFTTATTQIPLLTHVVTIDPDNYWISDFNKLDELYEIGYQAGKRYFSRMQEK